MMWRSGTMLTAVATSVVLAVAGCGTDDAATSTEPATTDQAESADATETTNAVDELFPDVLAASAERSGDTWTFSATLWSPYDTPERYADGWRVIGTDGTVYGIRELAHDHQNEQPFTRSLSGVEIPTSVTVVTVEGRDQVSGWGGITVEVRVPSNG
ncbi:MAG: hypothetical protein ACR2O6_10980 [Ilumatobacteraceae bacterium]